MSFVSIIDARKSITSLAAAATLSGQAESGGGGDLPARVAVRLLRLQTE